MVATKLTVEDIRNLIDRKLVVEMPDFKAMCSARNMVSYVRRAYPLPSNLDFRTSSDTESNVFTLEVFDKFEEVNEINNK